MSEDPQKRTVRRGLSALMADVGVSISDVNEQPPRTERQVSIERINPNPDQPRRTFAEDALADLASSIAEKGVLQPLIVRPDPAVPGNFQIVAGERRWRAAQRAGLHQVPVITRELTDAEVLEVAIIENIQRSDLNALEEAFGFRQLMDRFGHTQEQLSSALGKSRSHVANLLRLLKLPELVQDHLRQGALSAGHARALINAADPEALAAQVISRDLSVRETERLVKSQTDLQARPRQTRRQEKDADTRALEGDLSAALNLSVSIEHKADGEKGRLVLEYQSLDQLDRLCSLLSAGMSGDDQRED